MRPGGEALLRLFVVGALLSLVLAEAPRDEWAYAGRDCRPGACTVDDGALRLCAAPGQSKRLQFDPLVPPRPTFARFTWDPGSGQAEKALQVTFRDDQPEQHRVTLDVGQGLITTSHGLPPAAVRHDFAVGEQVFEVVHAHRLLVYLGGAEAGVLLLDLPLEPAQQDATQVALEGVDDGTCHRFTEIASTPYTWDCRLGRCEVDHRGLQLCGSFARLRWAPAIDDGTTAFQWNPSTFGTYQLEVQFRADAASGRRHSVSFELLRETRVVFGEGLNGAPMPVSLKPGLNEVRIVHRDNGVGLGEVLVYLNDVMTPTASAAYNPQERATKLEFSASSGFGRCHYLATFAPPA